MNQFAIVTATLLLAACSRQPDGIRLTHDQPAAPVTGAIPQAHSEPVFYNGKVYHFSLSPEQGGYGLAISGMNAAQQKDAVAVATTSLHHFACKDSQKARFIGAPTYSSNMWQFHGNCG